MENIGCKVIVSGSVQGVGFRYYTRREACKHGVSGYAKNLYDGDVEVVLYGESEKIVKMVKWLENGPRTAFVDDIKVSKIPYVAESEFLCF